MELDIFCTRTGNNQHLYFGLKDGGSMKPIKDKIIQMGDQTESIFRFVRRVNWTIFILLAGGTLGMFFLVFQPMETALKKSLTDNFIQISEVNYCSVNDSIQRGIEGAKSISSRTMIRDAIDDYKKGKTSLDELKEYTQSKYEDGAEVIEHLVTAERYVDGKIIAQYKDSDSMFDISTVNVDMTGIIEPISNIILSTKNIYSVNISPIIIDSKLVGYDQIVYDLTEQIDALNTQSTNTFLLDEAACRDLLAGSETIQTRDEMTVYSNSGSIYLVVKIQDNVNFVSSQLKENLFATVKELGINIFIGGIILQVAFIAAIYFYIIRFAKKQLSNLECSRNSYKSMVYIDPLTNAYSRHFLNIWNKSVRSSQQTYYIVMIDIDDFKTINDKYGHAVGDEALQMLACTINKSIRQMDFLIRFGGDEFVLILSGLDNNGAKNLIERIEDQLKVPGSYPVELSISCGISILDPDHELEKAVMQADQNMYEAKQSKKLHSEF